MKRISPFDEWGRPPSRWSATRAPHHLSGHQRNHAHLDPGRRPALRDATPYQWDQRIATTSIAPELLAKIVARQVNPKVIDQRLKIVRLYLQMDRYQEAQAELAQIIKDFPEHAEQFKRTERELTQRAAQRMLNEITVRREAGQHQFAIRWLNDFPHERVAGEILQKVKQTLEGYQNEFSRGTLIVNKIKELLALIADTKIREKLRPICNEIEAELNLNTLDRMTAFEQSLDDETMDAEEKLAAGLSVVG